MKKRVFLGLVASTLLMAVPTFGATGGWKRDNNGWWYQFSDGSYVRSSWLSINNVRYYMNGSGYMQTGWLKEGRDWYYLDTNNGDMKVGWVNINNTWYYMNPFNGGRMDVNTYTPDGYFVDASGAYQPKGRMTETNGRQNNSANTTSGSTSNQTSTAAFAQRVIELVNEERAQYGLSPLSADSALMNSAGIRAKELVTLFSHTRPDGSSYRTLMPSGLMTWGENVAMGQRSPESVMESWMNSQGHRENILSDDFSLIGVGCYSDGSTLYWVQNFGARR